MGLLGLVKLIGYIGFRGEASSLHHVLGVAGIERCPRPCYRKSDSNSENWPHEALSSLEPNSVCRDSGWAGGGGVGDLGFVGLETVFQGV